MKQIKMILSAMVFMLIGICHCTVFAAEYTIDFTREDAYEEIMNTTPEQAKRLYGGQADYYAALTDSDKDDLFDMIWNITASGILSESLHSDHIDMDTFSYEYFHSIISAFRQTKSDEEGLTNLRNNINEINEEYFSEGIQSSVEIVTQPEQTEPVESETTLQTTSTDSLNETTVITTTTEITAQKSDSHAVLIILLSVIVIAVGCGVVLIYHKKKYK